jgi:hypothetical protein
MAKRMTKGKFPTTQILGVVAGSVAAGMVEKLVSKYLPTSSASVKALVPIAAGVFLAMQKNEIVKAVGIIFSEQFKKRCLSTSNLFGKGDAAKKIVNILKKIKINDDLSKRFYDL